MINARAYEGKVVIVTGAGRGIGQGVAQAYAARGAQVVLAELKEDLGSDVERIITKQGFKALFVPTDVRDPEQIIALMKTAHERFGTVDVLITPGYRVLELPTS